MRINWSWWNTGVEYSQFSPFLMSKKDKEESLKNNPPFFYKYHSHIICERICYCNKENLWISAKHHKKLSLIKQWCEAKSIPHVELV